MKGLRQSRAKTLDDLLQSLQPVPPGEATTIPVLPPKPKPEEGVGKNDKEGLFNDLAGFFKFTYNNRKMASPELFGDKEETSKEETSKEDIKVGEEYFYTNEKGEKDVVKVISLKNQVRAGDDKTFGTDDDVVGGDIPGNSVWVTKATGRSGGKNTYSAKAYLADKSKLKKENVMKKENILTEAKFIKDPEVIKILKQKSGIDQNKLKFFEGFMTRVEIIRNKVKKMNNTGDKVMDQFVEKLKANPIMNKDFTKTFSVDTGNPQNIENMGRFINELIDIVYKGKFRGKTFKDIGGMVNKMGTLGGGNINKVSSVEESYLVERKGKKAKAKSDLKNNMISFITELMGMFQYMSKLKRQGKLGGDKPKGENKSDSQKTSDKDNVKQESKQKINDLLKEEIYRIKSLMFKIN
jgi:hypothetical protein